MTSYKDFYLRTIREHSYGLKLTLGGTGLGKTEGLVEAVKEHFQAHPSGKRVIYSTYRHQLVAEVEGKFKKADVPVRYLKADRDIIQGLMKDDKLLEMVERLAGEGLFKGDLTLDEPGSRTQFFERLTKAVKGRMELLRIAEKNNAELVPTITDELDNHCRDLMNVFKNQLKRLGKTSRHVRDRLLLNRDIWELFPYVALEHSEESSVLVATIHKLLRGFFDGKQNIKLGSIKGKIICLDEFDFLESTILEVMTNEPNLNNPIEFVRFFFEDFDYWSAQAFWEQSSENQFMKTLLSQAMSRIEDQLKEEKIQFPTIRHFRIEGDPFEKKKEIRLFQTNKLIATRPFWLEEVDRSWYLRGSEPQNGIQPHNLLRTFSRAKDRLLRAFQAFYQHPSHIEDIVHFVWNSKNDGQPGVYEKYIKENLAYYRAVGPRKEVLGLNPKTFQTGYDAGFRLFKLRIGPLPLDPQGVQLEQLELVSSPESVIGKLSDENLVFGLSATADLPRLVKCFNMEWLSRNALVVPFDDEDYQLVAKLKEEKAEKRTSSVNLVSLLDLTDNAVFHSKLEMLERIGFFRNEDEKGSDASRFRRERVMEALKCLEWIATSGKNATHLMFLSTFRNLRPLLTGEGMTGDAKMVWSGSIPSEKIGNTGYRIVLGGKSLAVAFLNAESSRRMSDADYLNEYETMFKEDKFVLITQYQSASNGVNLLCLDKDGKKVDFGGVHLIDSQAYWLPKLEGKRYEQPEEKQMIWYLWKLFDQGALTKGRFRECLETDHFHKVNGEYKQMLDHTLNQVALFHQSIGRVERKWEHTGLVEVSVGNAVLDELKKYLTDAAFLHIRQERKYTTSSLIDQIHCALLEHTSSHKSNATQSIEVQEGNAKAIVDMLLEALKLVRDCKLSVQERMEIRRIWEAFRTSVLRYDFSGRWTLPLGNGVSAEIATSSLGIHLDPEMELDRLHLNTGATRLSNRPKSGWQWWDLNSPFATRSQPIVQNAFSKQSLPCSPLEVASPNRRLWTPYVYQSVLKGRWGEEAIHAILSHHHVKLSAGSAIPDELYELVDFRLEGHPVFIDCKHYSTATQWQFGLGPSDKGYDLAFDSRTFLKELQKRLTMIRQHPGIGPKAQIFAINVQCLSTIRPTYYDERLRPVSEPEKCAIGIIPGTMEADNNYQVSAGFHRLVHYFQSLS